MLKVNDTEFKVIPFEEAKEFFGFIYITVNKVNGAKYIGQHKAKHEDYLGSGTVLGRAFEKYGIENFERFIIDVADSLDEINQKEKDYIKQFNAVEDGMFYNIAEGGGSINFWKGKKRGAEFSKTMSERNYFRGRDQSGSLNPMYGKSGKLSPRYGTVGELSPLYGRKWTEEQRRKLNETYEKKRKEKEEQYNSPEAKAAREKIAQEKHEKAMLKKIIVTYPDGREEILSKSEVKNMLGSTTVARMLNDGAVPMRGKAKGFRLRHVDESIPKPPEKLILGNGRNVVVFKDSELFGIFHSITLANHALIDIVGHDGVAGNLLHIAKGVKVGKARMRLYEEEKWSAMTLAEYEAMQLNEAN